MNQIKLLILALCWGCPTIIAILSNQYDVATLGWFIACIPTGLILMSEI